MIGKYTIIHGDVTEVLKEYSGELFHAVLCDPPYHLTSITERFGKDDSAPAKYGTDGVFQRSSKGFMNQCYDPETEILTQDGWISIKTVVDNKYSRKVYSLNPETDEIELVNAIDWQRYFFEGELLNFTGRSVDLLVTPNHKLWLSCGNGKKKFVEARNVNSNFSMYNQGEWNFGESQDRLLIGDKEYPAKAFVRFLGIYLGDGCVVHRKNQPKKQDFISISAKISRKKNNVISCLTSLGVRFTQYSKQTLVYDKNLNEYLSQFGHADSKYIPDWAFSLSRDLQEELLTGLLETDGHVSTKYKCVQYFTSSKKLADGVQRLAIHCGLSATIGYRCPRKANILGRNTSFNGGYVLSFLQKNKKLWFEKIDHKNKKQRLLNVPYSGYVYDITLDKNHILMTRRNGKTVWSSNSWDGGDVAFRPETWKTIASALFSGAFGMAFSSARGWHRMAVGIEDGGNLIYPSIFGWLNSQGMPKATRIDRRVDKSSGVDWSGYRYGAGLLKPAVEPIIVFQKPYFGRPLDNIAQTGAGAINIDGSRIRTKDSLGGGAENSDQAISKIPGWDRPWMHDADALEKHAEKIRTNVNHAEKLGRWPSNFIIAHNHDCRMIGTKSVKGYTINQWKDDAHPFGGGAGNEYNSEYQGDETIEQWDCVDECPVHRLNSQSGNLKSGDPGTRRKHLDSTIYGNGKGLGFDPGEQKETGYGDSGGASRFFFSFQEEEIESSDPILYEAKSAMKERELGLESKSEHPTHKPIALTQYLATMLLPPPEYAPRRLLVPFSGVGSEVIGALLAGWDEVVGVELNLPYVEIAENRINFWISAAEYYGIRDFKELLSAVSKDKNRSFKPEIELEQEIFESKEIDNNGTGKQTKLF